MISLKYDNITVTIPDSEDENYENIAYAKASHILAHSFGKKISVPSFTKEEKQDMIDNNDKELSLIEKSKPVLLKSEKINKDSKHSEVLSKDDSAEKLSEEQVNHRIKNFLDIPTLTKEWKAQFKAIENK
jgi:hypothetical protein